jgi:hypothetical protein
MKSSTIFSLTLAGSMVVAGGAAAALRLPRVRKVFFGVSPDKSDLSTTVFTNSGFIEGLVEAIGLTADVDPSYYGLYKAMRTTFRTEFSVRYPLPQANHSHALLAVDRNAIGNAIRHFIGKMRDADGNYSFEAYELQPDGTAALRKDNLVYVEHQGEQDLGKTLRADELKRNCVVYSVDSVNYSNLGNYLRYGLPCIFQTFYPDKLQGNADGVNWYYKDGKFHTNVNGGGSYEEELWDFFSKDKLYVTGCDGRMYYSIDLVRSPLFKHRCVVLLTPMSYVTMGYHSYFQGGCKLQRIYFGKHYIKLGAVDGKNVSVITGNTLCADSIEVETRHIDQLNDLVAMKPFKYGHIPGAVQAIGADESVAAWIGHSGRKLPVRDHRTQVINCPPPCKFNVDIIVAELRRIVELGLPYETQLVQKCLELLTMLGRGDTPGIRPAGEGVASIPASGDKPPISNSRSAKRSRKMTKTPASSGSSVQSAGDVPSPSTLSG